MDLLNSLIGNKEFKRYAFLVFGLVFLIIGLALYGRPVPVIQSDSYLRDLGVFFIFLFFYFSLIGAGRVFIRATLREAPHGNSIEGMALSLGFGSLALAFGAMFLSFVIPFGPGLKWPTVLVLVGVLLYGVFRRNEEGVRQVTRLDRVEKFFIAVFAFAVILRALQAHILPTHGDAYYAYLVGPRLIFDDGGYGKFVEYATASFYTGVWEYLFLLGNNLLGGEPGEGLDAVQRFAQWCSVGIGMVGVTFVAYSIGLRLKSALGARFSNGWIWLAAIAAISVSSIRYLIPMAKTDFGVFFWAVLGILLLLRKNVFTAFVFLGVATVSKLSIAMLPVTAGLLGAFLVKERYGRFFFKALAGGICGALPLAARNIALTGNPFFPFMNNLFKSSLLPQSVGDEFAGFTRTLGSPELSGQIRYLLEASNPQPWMLLTPLLLILPFVGRWLPLSQKDGSSSGQATRTREPAILALIVTIAFFLFNLLIRPSTQIRYHGPTLILASLLGVVALASLIHLIRSVQWKGLRGWSALSRWGGSVAFLVVSAWIISTSHIPVFVLGQLNTKKFPPGSIGIQNHFGAEAKEWLRAHAMPDEKIASVGDYLIYYLLDRAILPIEVVTWMDEKIYPLASEQPSVRLSALRELGVKYFYITKEHSTTLRLPIHKGLFEEGWGSEKCRAFSKGNESYILDLECWERAQKDSGTREI